MTRDPEVRWVRGGRRKPFVGIYVDPAVDKSLAHLAVDSDTSKSELYELSARLLLALVSAGGPRDCLNALDADTRARLEEVLARVKGVEQ